MYWTEEDKEPKEILRVYRFNTNRLNVWVEALLTEADNRGLSNLDLVESQMETFKEQVDLFSSLSREARRNNLHKYTESFSSYFGYRKLYLALKELYKNK